MASRVPIGLDFSILFIIVRDNIPDCGCFSVESKHLFRWDKEFTPNLRARLRVDINISPHTIRGEANDVEW